MFKSLYIRYEIQKKLDNELKTCVFSAVLLAVKGSLSEIPGFVTAIYSLDEMNLGELL